MKGNKHESALCSMMRKVAQCWAYPITMHELASLHSLEQFRSRGASLLSEGLLATHELLNSPNIREVNESALGLREHAQIAMGEECHGQ
jgi:exopolyphosphatase/pppGpp-phosphohydrolase